MEKLDLTGCTTNKEVSAKVMARMEEVNLEKMQADLSKDFVYQEKTIRTIYAALSVGNNAILHGPAGFGKSAIVEAMCEYIGLPVIYKVGYEGMTAEELLGVPNMTKLLNDSTYEVAFENSVFAKPGILILEEFCDTGAATAAALKDILTAKGFREGDSKKESLISSIIITGNKRPEDLAVDDTTAAFYRDRFPHRRNVIWEKLKEENYLAFFNAYYKNKYTKNFSEFRLLAKLCVKTDHLVSPRIAAKAGDTMIKLGVEFLDTIEDIDTSDIDRWIAEAKLETKLYGEKEVLDNFEQFIDELIPPESLGQRVHHDVLLHQLQKLLNTRRVSDQNMQQYEGLRTALRKLRQINFNKQKETVNIKGINEQLETLITYEK